MYGNNPRKLLNKIIENKLIKMNVLPLNPIGPIRVLNSLCNVIVILFHIYLIRLGINQNLNGITKNPKIVLNQFNEREKIDLVGSNTENRLVIIFNLFC